MEWRFSFFFNIKQQRLYVGAWESKVKWFRGVVFIRRMNRHFVLFLLLFHIIYVRNRLSIQHEGYPWIVLKKTKTCFHDMPIVWSDLFLLTASKYRFVRSEFLMQLEIWLKFFLTVCSSWHFFALQSGNKRIETITWPASKLSWGEEHTQSPLELHRELARTSSPPSLA